MCDEASDGQYLVPFIGSGLNRLAEGGVNSWGALVSAIRDAVSSVSVPWSEHERRTAQLSYPEELELLLSMVKPNKEARRLVCKTFREMLGKPQRPSDVHERLVRLVPPSRETNYNRILEQAANDAATGHARFDLTDPTTQPGQPYLSPGAIMHLHGVWPDSLEEGHIFWGVGKEPVSDQGGFLVLTEHQYHRLYNQRVQFQRSVHRLFSDEHLLLFMGSGLGRDELGVHAYLRDLQTAGGSNWSASTSGSIRTLPRERCCAHAGSRPSRFQTASDFGRKYSARYGTLSSMSARANSARDPRPRARLRLWTGPKSCASACHPCGPSLRSRAHPSRKVRAGSRRTIVLSRSVASISFLLWSLPVVDTGSRS